MSLTVQILPSLLAGDYGHLETSAQRAQAAGADALHMDIMDGHFVPNLSMGPDVVRLARGRTRLPLNVHLMLTRPQDLLDAFVGAGAHALVIHIEARCDVAATLRAIRARGVRPGLAVNPETPAEAVLPALADADFVLCMSVHPGFGGQAFMPEVLPTIAALRAGLARLGRDAFDIVVDGGIDAATVADVAAAGANVIVAGNALFTAPDMHAALATLRQRAETALGGRGAKPN